MGGSYGICWVEAGLPPKNSNFAPGIEQTPIFINSGSVGGLNGGYPIAEIIGESDDNGVLQLGG